MVRHRRPRPPAGTTTTCTSSSSSTAPTSRSSTPPRCATARARSARQRSRRRWPQALFSISARLAMTERPLVSSATRPRTYGVAAGPWIPAASGSGERLGDRLPRPPRAAARRQPASGAATSSPVVGPSDQWVARPRPRRGVGNRTGQRSDRCRPRKSRPAGGAPAQHRYAARLEVLERQVDVEDRLRAGADHQHRRPRELVKVGRDVESGGATAMHAANAAGGEDADAGQMPRRSSSPRPSFPPSRPRPGRRERRTRRLAGRAAADSSIELVGARPTISRPAWTATVAGSAPVARTAASARSRPRG